MVFYIPDNGIHQFNLYLQHALCQYNLSNYRNYRYRIFRNTLHQKHWNQRGCGRNTCRNSIYYHWHNYGLPDFHIAPYTISDYSKLSIPCYFNDNTDFIDYSVFRIFSPNEYWFKIRRLTYDTKIPSTLWIIALKRQNR